MLREPNLKAQLKRIAYILAHNINRSLREVQKIGEGESFALYIR